MFILEDKDKKIFIREAEFTATSVSELSFIYGSVKPRTEHFLNIFRDVPQLLIHNINSGECLCPVRALEIEITSSNYDHLVNALLKACGNNNYYIVEDIRHLGENMVVVTYYNIEDTTIYAGLNTYFRNRLIDNFLRTI